MKVAKILNSDIISLLLIFLLIFAVRLPVSTKVVINNDEANYLVVAQDLIRGGTPYKTAWDHKGPVLYFIFALAIKFIGENIFLFRIFTTFYLLVSMFFVYLISRRLFEGKVGLVPPLIYGLFFSNSRFGGLSSNSELFMMLPAIIATFCFIIYLQNAKRPFSTLVICGLFSAMAIFIKPVAFFTVALFPITLLLLRKFDLSQYSWKNFAREIFSFLAGGLTISALIFCYFIFRNAVSDFYNAFFVFNWHYIVSTSINLGFFYTFLFLKSCFNKYPDFITVLAAISAALLLLKKSHTGRQRNIFYFISGLSVLSMVGAVSCRNAEDHYFLQMALGYSLLIALGISQIEINKADLKKLFYLSLIFLWIMLIPIREIILFPIRYKNRELSVYHKIAQYVRDNTVEGDTIFVIGEPIIYFLSTRKAPVKYFYWVYHYGKWEEILQSEKYTLQVFSENRPKYFAFIEDVKERNWRVEYLEKFIADNYHLEKKFDDYKVYAINKNVTVN